MNHALARLKPRIVEVLTAKTIAISATSDGPNDDVVLDGVARKLRGWTVLALIYEARIPITNGDAALDFDFASTANRLAIAQLLREVEVPCLRTGRGEPRLMSGLDLYRLARSDGFVSVDADATGVDVVPGTATTIAHGAAATVVARWLIPYARPACGERVALNTAPAAGDLPAQFTVRWANKATYQSPARGSWPDTDVVMTASGSITRRVLAIVTRDRRGTAVAAERVYKRLSGITDGDGREVPAGLAIRYAQIELSSAQAVTAGLRVRRGEESSEPTTIGDLLFQAELSLGGLSSLPSEGLSTGTTSATASDVPICVDRSAPEDADVEGLAYRLDTAGTHALVYDADVIDAERYDPVALTRRAADRASQILVAEGDKAGAEVGKAGGPVIAFDHDAQTGAQPPGKATPAFVVGAAKLAKASTKASVAAALPSLRSPLAGNSALRR